MILRKNYPILFLVAVAVFFGACTANKSTQTSFIGKNYQDFTLRYNYYFNAKLLLDQNLQLLKESHSDDFSRILPIYRFDVSHPNSAIFSDMDKARKKASIGIQLYPNSKYVDDCYLIIGITHYLKGNFPEAANTFQFITSEFSSGIRPHETRQQQRKREQKEKSFNGNFYYDQFFSFLRHKPARYEAMIWIARSYLEMDKFSEARSIISHIEGDKSFPDQLRPELNLVIAHMHIRQNDYANAAMAVRKVIDQTSKNRDLVRYNYILAQLHQFAGNSHSAISAYENVLDLTPDHEMEFYAKINIANLSKTAEGKTDEDIIKMLLDMSRNPRFRPFLGEIYVSLAEIYLSRNDLQQAESYYQMAVNNSMDESSKANAYLALANIFFDRELYPEAKNYHDSTLLFLPRLHRQYNRITERRDMLGRLVEQIQIIEHQDSLQKMASLPDAELERIFAEIAEEERRKLQRQEREVDFTTEDHQRQMQGVASWPFDDPAMRSRGFNNFRNVWGNREHEDNWRRSERSQIATFDEGDFEHQTQRNSPVSANPNRQNLREGLPVSEDAILESTQKIIDAYFTLANIYKDQLQNDPKAIETFEELLNRYPANKYRLETAYNLYLLHSSINEMQKAEVYKQLVLKEYPESLLAQAIINPNFAEESEQAQKEAEKLYAQLFHFYENKEYEKVISYKKPFMDSLEVNPIAPRFEMLEALSYGKIGKLDSMGTRLQQIVNKEEDQEITQRALAILHRLEDAYYAEAADTARQIPFIFNPNDRHKLVIMFTELSPKINNVLNALANYNTSNFSDANLRINQTLLDNNTQLLIVNGFADSRRAIIYYNAIRYNERIFNVVNEEDYTIFTITQHNYGIFFREKDIPGYMNFFTRNYLKEE